MANGLNIVSTPVGSLPTTFENNKEIMFANNIEEFSSCYTFLLENKYQSAEMRVLAQSKAKTFTLEKFIKRVFI